MKSINRIWNAYHVWRLSQSWSGGRKWYQYIELGEGLTTKPWSAGDTELRTSSFQSFLQEEDFLNNDDVVVDIGCNAGIFSLIAAQKCRQVYGIEIDSGFLKQAKFVKKRWKAHAKRVDNVTFLHGSIMEHLDLVSHASVIFASKVLYHALLGDDLDRLMETIELGRPRLIMMQGHTVRGPYGQSQGMQDLVEKYGFEYRLIAAIPEFPVAIAIREGQTS